MLGIFLSLSYWLLIIDIAFKSVSVLYCVEVRIYYLIIIHWFTVYRNIKFLFMVTFIVFTKECFTLFCLLGFYICWVILTVSLDIIIGQYLIRIFQLNHPSCMFLLISWWWQWLSILIHLADNALHILNLVVYVVWHLTYADNAIVLLIITWIFKEYSNFISQIWYARK